jgi:capsule polysaccharide modification protein KpsS
VNSNANFFDNKNSLSNKFNQLCSTSHEKVITNDTFVIFFKILELMYIFFINLIFRNHEMNEILPKLSSFFTKNSIPKNKRPEQYILFIDQVELDVNNTHFGSSAEDICKKINNIIKLTKKLKPDLKIVRRAHPRQPISNIANNLSREFKSIYFDTSEGSLEEAIQESFLVLTVNSTGGLDSLLCGKPVYLFGKSYYQDLFGVIDESNLESYLKEELLLERELISHEANLFIENNFISIDYRGGNFMYIYRFDNFLDFIS